MKEVRYMFVSASVTEATPGPRNQSISIHGFPKNPRMSTWLSMTFGCQSSIIHTSVDIHIDIQAWISMQGHSAMDIHK